MNKSAGTRLDILQRSFELIYKNGFQATSIDAIIASTNVTKGAFFYHFKNKEEMGLALITEVLSPGMQEAMIRPLQAATEPLGAIYKMMEGLLLHDPFFKIEYGCPAVNLIEEMGPLNELFSSALRNLLSAWQNAIQLVLEDAKAAGKIQEKTDSKEVALFITAGYGGIRNMGKILGKDCYTSFLTQFKAYLNALQPNNPSPIH
ncbi:TetR/AcrR family transcriptional regulator [Dyadobacter fanqingshengii]|uniref:TetR/AcrR family transcriptional regulator n=1 Tax=Dyadobacter fanqingshengii TaxID=2906443 RepID=A0A9X1PFS7_9BACT|nr:TetR/AcrR family transcriptional regulator [Dyadobacter fanqingshengii]MCF0043078.1 TetR/AcrR family transcriptional regulator [Dyadobacter fanqingshengii]USJ35631.1 TetR/AcrR family transcriptional regulator [Dyadobacter fanqingshengii]